MSSTNLACKLLYRLEKQGIDPGAPQDAKPGQRFDGSSGALLILNGVVARQNAEGSVAMGLAGPGDLINFDGAQMTGDGESGLWLTRGAGLVLSVDHLALMDRLTLIEVTSADLRRRLVGACAEIQRLARLRVSQRLATLLLEVHRLGDISEVRLRQSDFADLLAVRRAGVSTACGELQALQAIRVRRGAIQLANIAALQAAARSAA